MNTKAGLIAIALALSTAPFAPAAPELVKVEDFKKDLPKVAQKVLDIVDGEKQLVVAMGEFKGPAQHDANFGPGIQDLLSQALEQLRPGVVKKNAELSVLGRYAFVDDPSDSSRVLVKLTVEVIGRNDERIKEFVAQLTNNADIAKILGLTVSLDPDGSKDQRNKEIKLRLGDPKVVIDGSRIRATADSKLAVELFVKGENAADFAPRAARAEQGLAFVDIKRGEIYEVVLHNGGNKEVAVALSIDGLDAFNFSEVRDPKTKKPKYSHYILGPGKSATIVGWHLRDAPPNNYSSFLVTEYGKGASVRVPTQSQGKTGVLTVAFSFTSPAGKGRGGSETGFGPPKTVDVQPLQRDFEQPHEFVTVRYAR